MTERTGNLSASMKVPPKRKGNPDMNASASTTEVASMKVPPKRKGNPPVTTTTTYVLGLNESPSQKEGK